MRARISFAVAGVLAAAVASPAFAFAQPGGSSVVGAVPATDSRHGLPVHRIERIMQVDGTVGGGVLDIEINRPYLHVKGRDGVPFRTGFQIQHDITFQALDHGKAILNADVALKPGEIQPVIDLADAPGPRPDRRRALI